MQGTPYNLLLDEQFTLRQDTDTATPRTTIPIYLIHNGNTPFCSNTACFCQCGKRAAAMLYQEIAAGRLQLAQLIQEIPQDCQLYGHSWQVTEHPNVKECSLCHIRGYCPGCTPVTPANGRPFYCTYHTRMREV